LPVRAGLLRVSLEPGELRLQARLLLLRFRDLLLAGPNLRCLRQDQDRHHEGDGGEPRGHHDDQAPAIHRCPPFVVASDVRSTLVEKLYTVTPFRSVWAVCESHELTQPLICGRRTSHSASVRWSKETPWNWMLATGAPVAKGPAVPAGAPGAAATEVLPTVPLMLVSHIWPGITMETSCRTPDHATLPCERPVTSA